MAILGDLKKRMKAMAAPLAGSLLVAYFAFHVVEGDRGVKAWQRVSEQTVQAESLRDQMRSQKVALERHIAKLRPDSLDPDFLEERARLILGYVPANGLVVGDGRVPTQSIQSVALKN